MSTFDTSGFLDALPWAAAAIVAVLAATFAVARIAGKHSVIDTAWGLLFVAVAVTAFVASSGSGDPARRGLLLALPVAWGLRLAVHIGRRSIGRPEDPRYEALLEKARGNRTLYALGMVYGLQGVLAALVSVPILLGAFERGPVGIIAWIGVALWLVGVFFEAVGDAQLERFRADPGNRGTVLQTGLWRYTRHPNYFGDACVWWGIYLVAAQHWPGVLSVPALILMTILLTRGSGVRILDRHMARHPGWVAYAARTSAFVPRPPRQVSQ